MKTPRAAAATMPAAAAAVLLAALLLMATPVAAAAAAADAAAAPAPVAAAGIAVQLGALAPAPAPAAAPAPAPGPATVLLPTVLLKGSDLKINKVEQKEVMELKRRVGAACRGMNFTEKDVVRGETCSRTTKAATHQKNTRCADHQAISRPSSVILLFFFSFLPSAAEFVPVPQPEECFERNNMTRLCGTPDVPGCIDRLDLKCARLRPWPALPAAIGPLIVSPSPPPPPEQDRQGRHRRAAAGQVHLL